MDARVVYRGAFGPAQRALAGRFGEGALVPEPARTRSLVELDTVERSLERRGATLGFSGSRESGRLTWSTGPEAGIEVARATPPAFAWEVGEADLRSALTRACGARRLLPLRQVELRERPVRRLDERGKTVVRLGVLRRRFRSPPGEGAWSPAEELLLVEPVRGYGAAHDELVRVLEAVADLERVPDGVLCARPAPALPVPYDPPAPWPAVDRGEVAASALRRVVLRQLAVAEAQEAGLRADLDSEFLHDLRVAARRARSLLAQLKGALVPGEVDDLREGLRWLGRATGPLRDDDVLLEQLHALEPDLAEGLGALVELLEQRRAGAHAEVVAALDSRRWSELRGAWRTWGQGTAPLDGPTLGALLAGRVERLARRIRRDGARLGSDAPAEELHALRIRCKQLRYLLECAPDAVAPDERRRCVRALKGLQEVLGAFNDARLQARELEELARPLAVRDRLALLPLGRLVERRRAEERAAREAFVRRFDGFAAKRSRRDLARLAAALRGAGGAAR